MQDQPSNHGSTSPAGPMTQPGCDDEAFLLLNPKNSSILTGEESVIRRPWHYYLALGVWLFLLGSVVILLLLPGSLCILTAVSAFYHQSYAVAGGRVVDLGKPDEVWFDHPYEVDYIFQPPGTNHPYYGQDNIPESAYRRLVVGGSIQIRYDPHNPEDSEAEVVAIRRDRFYYIIGAVMVAMFAIALVFLGTALEHLHSLRLEQRGKIVYGELVDCQYRTHRANDYKMVLRYRFTSPKTGRVLLKKAAADTRLTELQPRPGMRVAILYGNDRDFKPL
jgi:hypothetical protein